jgi:hypothetical protein
MHTQPLPAECITENDEDSMSGLFKKFDSLKVTFSESDFSGRYSWVETQLKTECKPQTSSKPQHYPSVIWNLLTLMSLMNSLRKKLH